MDLLDALETAEIEYRDSNSSEGEITICCPFCEEEGESQDTRFRLGINIRTGQAQCFNCGKRSGGGDYIFNELQRVLNTGEIEASQEKRRKKKSSKVFKGLPLDFKLLQPPDECGDYWNKVAYRYVRKRGVTRKQIKEKDIGFSMAGNFHHRILFPVYWKKTLKGLVGRDFTSEQTPPYKNSVGQKAVYNIPKTPQKAIVLVEGVFDALAVERAVRSYRFKTDSGGLLGHSITDEQLAMLEPYDDVYLWLDPDFPGIEGMVGKRNNKGIVHKLWDEKKNVFCIIPKGLLSGKDFDARDPDEISERGIVRRIKGAEVFTESLVDKLKSWMVFDE